MQDNSTHSPGPAAMQVLNLNCSFNDVELFADVGFALATGDILQIRGANGSGKTTLLRILAGLKRIEEGEILWQNMPIRDIENDYFQQLRYIGHRNGIKSGLSVLENLTMQQVLLSHHATESADRILNKIGLHDDADTPAGNMSSGQLRRLAIARLMHNTAKIWLLDEPYTALDDKGKELINTLLLEHSQQNGVAIIATHEPLSIDLASLKTFNLS